MKKIFNIRFGTDTYWDTMRALDNLKRTYGDDIEIHILRNGRDVNIIIDVKDEKKVRLGDIEAINYLL